MVCYENVHAADAQWRVQPHRANDARKTARRTPGVGWHGLLAFISPRHRNFPPSLAEQVQIHEIDVRALQNIQQQFLDASEREYLVQIFGHLGRKRLYGLPTRKWRQSLLTVNFQNPKVDLAPAQ